MNIIKLSSQNVKAITRTFIFAIVFLIVWFGASIFITVLPFSNSITEFISNYIYFTRNLLNL